MNKIQDAQIEDKKVLLRVDFNVPIKGSAIENDKRIRESLPTIQYLLDGHVAKITIVTHLGKPDGKIDQALSLYPVANRLAKLLKIDQKFDNPQKEYQISNKIILLENLRFNPGEETNDTKFAKTLASYADLYVNDAFGTAHRAHASTEGVTHFLPSFAGLLIQKEVENLDKLLKGANRPFTIILGGAKIADKLPVLKNLTSQADNFLIGGAIASTFLAARRHYLGKSLIDKNDFKEANSTWTNLIDEPSKNLYLPKDLVLSLSAEKAEDVQVVDVEDLLEPNYEDYLAADIGPETIELYDKIVSDSKTVFWNGDMGISEVKEFANGTVEIAQALKDLSADEETKIVIGGGDTVAAVEKIEPNKKNIFLSTGGGATLEYLSGRVLPGLKALE
jgi:phosphoglycerate kinase